MRAGSCGIAIMSVPMILSYESPEEASAKFAIGRFAEFLALSVGIPLTYVLATRLGWHISPIVLLLLVAAGCAAALLLDPTFDRRRLWNTQDLLRRLLATLPLLALGAVVMAGYIFYFEREQLFWLLRDRPGVWAALMIGYPLASVYPQELIYRAFLFHRYRGLFGRGWPMILVSALAFGYMHIAFANIPAVVMTLVGGIIFARRYDRTHSLLVTSIEHALFGQLIFTIGLAHYLLNGTLLTILKLTGQ